MERQYIIKSKIKEIMYDNKIKQKDIAEKLGVTESYICRIINRNYTKISKLMAYAFCKAIDSELEIEDLFEII